MRKIKKELQGFALLSSNLMGKTSNALSQPLFNSSISWQNSFRNTTPSLISTPNIKPKGVDISNINNKISSLQNSPFDLKKQKSAQREQNWKDFKSDVSEFAGSEVGKNLINTGINSALDIGLSTLGKESDKYDASVNAVSDAVGMLGPWGQAAGVAIKGLNFLDKALGKTTKNFKGNTGLSGYQDFSTQGKQFRFTESGARKRSEKETKLNKNMFTNAMSNANDINLLQNARTQSIQNTGITNKRELMGGTNLSTLMAKKGASLEDIRNYIKCRKNESKLVQNQNLDDENKNSKDIEIAKFANGGNLIPSGALHKNKHNLETINSELDGEITKKGIPVISIAEKGDVLEFENDGITPKTLAEGGEIIQHAEIEKDEVILNLSLTKKLIELMKSNNTLEAGKILAKDLMENTTDNTGLINKIAEDEN